MPPRVTLERLEGEYAVSRLPPGQAVPAWVTGPGFANISLCDDEISVVTRVERVPEDVTCDRGWCALKLTEQFAFDQPGIVLSVVRPVSEGGDAVFLVSTFERDYLLVRAANFERVRARLLEAGHRFA